MADAVVDFVWQKLEDALTGPIKDAARDALINEVELLQGVSGKVDAVKRELPMIKSFLKDADARRSSEERVKKWVEDIRDVAYSIEDAVDNFQAEVDWINYKRPGFWNCIKRFFKKPMILPALHKLGTDMDNVKSSIEEIAAAKSYFGIYGLGANSSTSTPLSRPLALIHPDIMDEMEVVGFESHKRNIIGQLLHENTSRRSVISIVGPGGIGKTTLAKMIYDDADVKKSFEVLIWLSVGQEFNQNNQIHLLKRMHETLQPANQRDHHDLAEPIRASMKEKKYLVVMDDIWTADVWQHLQMVFPDAKNGSRVLITSRFTNVAPATVVYELPFLNEEQSVQLLLKKAIPDKDPNDSYPQDILELAKQFAKKCGGLPLQLVVLGGLLSQRSPNYSAWHRFTQTMDWFKDGKKCFDSIEISYEHMPSHLKPCFMSFSVFPEDYEIDAQSLISYWCTVGFISQQGSGKMSDRAEECLEELYQRCMIQVTRRNPSTGSIEQCKVHTLLRNLAVYKAKEKSLITVYSNSKQEGFQEQPARHASFHFHTPEIQNNSTEKKDVLEYTGANVRSLMFFGDILPIHSRMKLVKVLIVHRARVTFSNGRRTWLRNLIGLRHLEFRECQLENNTLPEEINFLHNLKYLDLTDTVVNLPQSIMKNNKALTLVVNRSEANILALPE